MGQLRLPAGKRIAVNMGADFDAQSLWLGAFNMPSPAYMARGEFGAEVGTPRLAELYDKYDIKTTWFTPGHTVDTWPDICRDLVARGHEFAIHGYYHENPTKIEPDTERRLLELALDTFDTQLGVKPVGYRSPYWDYSEATLEIVEELGFEYDSSLMARDLVPYRPRRWQVRWEQGSLKGKASKVLEIPVNWYLDDFPPLAYVTGIQPGQQDTETAFRRWKDIFDYAYERVENACYSHACHPQIIGQAHHILMYERLLDYIASKDGVWLATCAEIAACWEDDEEDLQAMEMEDLRGVEAAPVGSGFN
jgi:peptidoglycan/xylan/chitin deacetylase (PgdA/CDA1 family)